MNSASGDVCRFVPKTYDVEFVSNAKKKTVVTPVTVVCDSNETIHAWKFVWESACQKLGEKEGFQHDSYACTFSFSGKSKKSYKYEKSFYEITITGYYKGYDVLLAKQKSDLNGPDYDQFRYITELVWSPYVDVIKVKLALQSEIPPQNTIKMMLDRGRLTDVVIKTKDKDFPCHKLMLASKSDYFDKMFEMDMKENNENAVNWVDVVEADVVQDLLHYVYTDQTPPNIASTCMPLLEVAHMCLMDGLSALCTEELKKTINAETIANILSVAVKNESKGLQEAAVNFIVQNYDFSREDSPAPWEDLQPEFGKSLVITIIKSMAAKKITL